MASHHLTAKQTIIAITVALACFLPPFIGSATGLIAADIIEFFGYAAAFGSGLFPWIFTVYTLTSTIFLIPAARLADKFNKKIFFTIGVLLLGVGSLGIGLSPTIEIMLVMRAVQGVGNALMFGTAIALLADIVPEKHRGTAVGIAMTGVFLGQLAAPLAAGALTNAIGWSAVFIVLFPVAIISFILSIIFIPKDKPKDTGKFDWIGSLIFIAGMALAVYGFSKLPETTAIASMIAGIILLILFFIYEKRCSNPLIPINLILHNKSFTFNSGANLLYYVAIYSMDSLISTYMAELWGISDPLLRALIITTEGLILALFTIVAGKFFDHQADFSARICVFHGVGYDIRKHAHNMHTVYPDPVMTDRSIDHCGKRNVLCFRAARKNAVKIIFYFINANRLFFNILAPRFYGGHIQNIIDQGNHVSAGHFDLSERFQNTAFVIDILFGNIRKTDDRVHRRADIM